MQRGKAASEGRRDRPQKTVRQNDGRAESGKTDRRLELDLCASWGATPKN